MGTKRGLLAFLCAVVACTTALLHVPFVTGGKQLLKAFSEPSLDMDNPLLAALTPPDAPKGLTAPGAFHQLRLGAIRAETRADGDLKRMGALHQIPFPIMKAHLAQVSKGVIDTEGLFWVPDPDMVEDGRGSAEKATMAKSQKVKDAGKNLKRLEEQAAKLGSYRQATGSVNGALLAWIAGPQRAQRVIALSNSSLKRDLESLRRHMIVPYREESRQWLCTVRGLSLAMQSRWPTRSRLMRGRSMRVVQLDAVKGEKLLAPMEASIGFVGRDGSRGICVEMVHACGLRSEFCGLSRALVKGGQKVGPGAPVGQTGDQPVSFTLWHGHQAIDPMALLPPEPEPQP